MMKQKLQKTLLVLLVGFMATLGLVACGHEHEHEYGEYVYDNNATFEQNGTKTAACIYDGCNATDTMEAEGTMLDITLAFVVEDNAIIGVTDYFVEAQVKNLVIPSKINGAEIKKIADGAFYNCSSLANITIPDSVITVENGAFYGCRGLTNVVIGNGVTSIGDSVFSNCGSETLRSIVIGDGVDFIADGAFRNVILTSIEVSENNETYKSIDGNLYGGDGETLIQYAIGKKEASFVVPDGVATIGYRAFYNCGNLTSVVIPNSVTTIGEEAFKYCGHLNYNTYHNAKYLGNENNPYHALIVPIRAGISSCSMHKDTKVIAGSAFHDCWSLISVVIGDGVTTIGEDAFFGCESLTSIVIPDSVTTIGDAAFKYCLSLTSIEIPNSVTIIGEEAFYNCARLTSVVIPDSVTTIGEEAFHSCARLTSVVIPDSVTTIGEEAFDNNNLKSIKYRGTEAQWQAISKGRNWDGLSRTYTITYNYKD